MKIIHHNTNFTKQHKSQPHMVWPLLYGTRGFSHLKQENKLGSPTTGSFFINIKNRIFS